MTDKIKEAVLKSNMPDGVYETYSDKETGWFMKAMHEYASLVSASKDEEIARLKEDVKELVECLDLIVGSMSLERVERFELNEKSKSLIQKHEQ